MPIFTPELAQLKAKELGKDYDAGVADDEQDDSDQDMDAGAEKGKSVAD